MSLTAFKGILSETIYFRYSQYTANPYRAQEKISKKNQGVGRCLHLDGIFDFMLDK